MNYYINININNI